MCGFFVKGQKVRGRARAQHKREGMNKLEEAYSKELERLKLEGKVQHYSYEAVKLRLADRTFYTPDFFVVDASGEVEFHETKGFWEDDARVKIKVAAETFPFRFVGVTQKSKKNGGGFEFEEF